MSPAARHADHSDHQASAPARRGPYRTVALVYATGLCAALLLFLTVRGWERTHLRSQFERLSEDRVQAIKGQLDRDVEVLESIGNFYAASRLVEREEFRTFVSDSLVRHPEIRAFSWTPWVPAGERAAYEAALQAEGYPETQITEEDGQGRFVRAGGREAYAPVTYMEPLAPRRALLGFDLASDAARRAAMDRARDTGVAVATEVVPLKGPDRPMGFGVYLPVYRNGPPHETLNDRRRHLHGFVIAIFATSQMIEYAMQPMPPAGIDLSFYATPATAGQQPFYVHRSRVRPASTGADAAGPAPPPSLQWATTLNVAGHAWVVRCASTPTFFAAHRRWEAFFLLAFGLLLTGFVGSRVQQTLLRAAQVERLVAQRTVELSEANAQWQQQITERQRAEQAIRDLSSVVTNAASSVIITDPDGVITYVNPAFEAMTGYAKAEAVGQTPRLLKSGQHDAQVYQTLWQTILAGQSFREVLLNKRKNGECYYEEKQIFTLHDEMGRQTGFASIGQDITERQQAERQLHERTAALTEANRELTRRGEIMDRLLADLQMAREQLEAEHQRLEQSNRQLEESYTALKTAHQQLMEAEKMESVGRLATGVAHEVKNPLTILLLGSEYLIKHGVNGDAEVAQVVRDMREAALRADAVVRGLQHVSTTSDVVLTDESINAVVEEALSAVHARLFHLTVLKELAQQLPPVRLDRKKMEQALIHLVLNAVDAMPTGGALTVRTYLKRLTSVAHDAGARTMDRFRAGETVLVVEVEDTGSGIPEDRLMKVFDPFFTTKPTGQGTGLGLTVVKKTVDLHGGMIDIQNKPPHGARVTLLLKLRAG